ncbi:MAG: hypothetical protein WBP64_18675 [Nitrososphaeraceae archaeon]
MTTRLEDLIIKEVSCDDLKFAPGTKILSKKEISLGQHYATDYYSGAQQVRNSSYTKREIQEPDGRKYIVASVGHGEFDSVFIYALKFEYHKVKNIPDDERGDELVRRQSYADDDINETKQCWKCGKMFTKIQAREQDGDWLDRYCGC